MRAKANRFEMWTSYYVISMMAFLLCYDVVDHIHKQNASRGLRYSFNPGPDAALLLLALMVIAGSFRMLQNARAPLRWMILIPIAAGVACSLVFSLRGVDRRVVAAVYTLPQLLLLFARKRPNNTAN